MHEFGERLLNIKAIDITCFHIRLRFAPSSLSNIHFYVLLLFILIIRQLCNEEVAFRFLCFIKSKQRGMLFQSSNFLHNSYNVSLSYLMKAATSLF